MISSCVAASELALKGLTRRPVPRWCRGGVQAGRGGVMLSERIREPFSNNSIIVVAMHILFYSTVIYVISVYNLFIYYFLCNYPDLLYFCVISVTCWKTP